MTPTLPGTLTMAEALLVLGLPDDPSAPLPEALTLRKAYVRAIKRYSPESNPQEFQNIRAAYELLEARRRWATDAADDRDNDRDDDTDDDSEAGHRDEPVVSTPDAHDLPLDVAPAPQEKAADVPAWHATLDELTAILANAAVLEDGVRPKAAIPEASTERLLVLIWLGWPETLDPPLIRFAARLFELGHHYEGHVVLERLLATFDDQGRMRGPLDDVHRARIGGISREVRERGENARLGWVYGPEHVDTDKAPDTAGTSRRTRRIFLLGVLFILLLSNAEKLAQWLARPSPTPEPTGSAWAEQSCRDYPSVCSDIRTLDRLVVDRQCARVVTQVQGFRAVIRLSLGDRDADTLTARAREYAGAVCLDVLDSKPAPRPAVSP